MKYTVRYAHLAEASHLKVGESLSFGDLIGIMGTSGQSKWPHLHIDLIKGFIKKIIRLKEIGPFKKYKPCKKQLGYFIDDDLFRCKFVITTPYLNKAYEAIYHKKHHAYDVVPKDRHESKEHFNIYWNRTRINVKNVEVLAVTFDQNGYVHTILIGYETL